MCILNLLEQFYKHQVYKLIVQIFCILMFLFLLNLSMTEKTLKSMRIFCFATSFCFGEF